MVAFTEYIFIFDLALSSPVILALQVRQRVEETSSERLSTCSRTHSTWPSQDELRTGRLPSLGHPCSSAPRGARAHFLPCFATLPPLEKNEKRKLSCILGIVPLFSVRAELALLVSVGSWAVRTRGASEASLSC